MCSQRKKHKKAVNISRPSNNLMSFGDDMKDIYKTVIKKQ